MNIIHTSFVSIISILAPLVSGAVLAQEDRGSTTIGEFAITEAYLPMVEGKNSCGTGGFETQTVSSARLTEEMFRIATCQFHVEDASVDERERAAETFAQLQTRGLPPGKQAFAALAEGILHCRIATSALASFRANNNHHDLALTRLCEARRRATASFSDVNWRLARFHYGAETGKTVADLVSEYRGCFVSDKMPPYPPLHRNIDSDCGLITGIDPVQTAAAARAETLNLLATAFGEKGPIGRLFINKQDLSDQIAVASEAKIVKLEQRAKVIAEIAAGFETQGKKIGEQMDFFDDYKSAYATAQAIFRTQTRWQDGLLIDKLDDDKNYREELVGFGTAARQGRFKELEDEAERIAETKSDGPYAKIIRFGNDLRKTRDQEANTRFQIRNLCRHFYCELAGESGVLDWKPFELACASNELASNPLCDKTDPFVRGSESGQKLKVSDLCVKAGFKAEYAQKGLEFSLVRQCFSEATEEIGQ